MKRVLIVSLLALGAGCAHQEAQPQPAPQSQPAPEAQGAPPPPTAETAPTAPGAPPADEISQEKASTPKTGSANEYSFQSAEGAFTATLTPTSIHGPTQQLTRTSNGLRGTVANRTLDLTWSGDSITGSFNNQPVNLKLVPSAGGVRIRGMWGGQIGDLTVGAKVIDGRIGRCGYTLQAKDDHYLGQSTCLTRRPVNTTVTLPKDLAKPIDGESAAILAALLGE